MKTDRLKNIKALSFIGLWLILGCSLFPIQMGPSIGPLKEKVIFGEGKSKALLIDIEGVISDQKQRNLLGSAFELGLVERVRETLRKAQEDNNIRAIMLRINSPGGTVTSSDIIYHELKKFKEKNNLKIYSVFMDVAASGGYYIALASDKIFAHPTTITGSIGVIAMKVNMKGLMEKIGVDMEVVKSGDKKDFLSPMRPFTKEEKRIFQVAINSYHDRFVNLIVENRSKLSKAKVSNLADGRIFNSQQALNNKLIDFIGYLDDAFDQVKKDIGVSDMSVIGYYRNKDYKPTIYSSLSQSKSINLSNINIFEKISPFDTQFMYLWAP